MAEFNGIPPTGINSIVRPAPVAPPPAIPGVEAGLKGGGLSGRMSSDTRSPAPGKPVERPDRDRTDPAQIAGPSPAFRANVLELELDLQNTIARVEAARGKRESDIAGGMAQDLGNDRDTPESRADKPVAQAVTVTETADKAVALPDNGDTKEAEAATGAG